ncbi:CoA pyrophosphatase [Nocardioidaceae bacterium]|nr:CoA pyrophosphatase [Nocardioidaceae bacterium]
MIPRWLEPVREGARTISVDQLTRFAPPEDADTRAGATLMLFGEGAGGRRELLLTERSHDMRSHPGQVSFPGGAVDPGDASSEAAALREAQEETGLDPAGVEVFGRLPDLWLPPSNFSVTVHVGWWAEPSPVSVVDPAEVHEVLVEPIDELLDPEHRFTVVGPSTWRSPGFWVGENKDVLLWGFTAGVISRLFDHVGWTLPWDTDREEKLPAHMLAGRERRGPRGDSADIDVPQPNTSFQGD